MLIIGHRYSKLNLIITIAVGLFLILLGIKLILQSSFDYKDYYRFYGPISRIEIIVNSDPYSDNRLLIQLKNYSNEIYINDIQLKDIIKIGDSITIYAKHNFKINKEQEISNVYGLYLRNKTLIDLNEKSRVNRFIGILLISIGLIIVLVGFIYYRFSKKEKYVFLDIDVKNLP